jgi:hypothetical protein
LQVTLFFLCRNPNLKKEFCNILLFWKWFSLTHKVNTSRIKFRIFGSDNSSEWLISNLSMSWYDLWDKKSSKLATANQAQLWGFFSENWSHSILKYPVKLNLTIYLLYIY